MESRSSNWRRPSFRTSYSIKRLGTRQICSNLSIKWAGSNRITRNFIGWFTLCLTLSESYLKSSYCSFPSIATKQRSFGRMLVETKHGHLRINSWKKEIKQFKRRINQNCKSTFKNCPSSFGRGYFLIRRTNGRISFSSLELYEPGARYQTTLVFEFLIRKSLTEQFN